MTILKCKMCGGNLNIEEGATTCTCEYCGTTQTIPKLDDEKKNKLYDRANRLRFNNEFDKAYSVYQDIVNDFPQESEAYWGLLLCKYGIEYVEDPYTHKRIPTCHRSSFESIFDDDNFEMVMENADPVARDIYRSEAKTIEEIRKGILEVSSKEEPYDIFICYKETDEYNNRTIDSVIAQDVYNALTEKGYRVFFSRISLEDKLGQEYEPYIFAALNSAKIMLVFGTKYDYFNAVWVKNEWSRFLQLIAKGEKKTLIPCYRDIDVYDMPKEFQHLQSQDMAKVGAIQDLVRGIGKIIPLNYNNLNNRKQKQQKKNNNSNKKTSANQHKNKRKPLLIFIVAVIACFIIFFAYRQLSLSNKYNNAINLYNRSNYDEAISEFEKLNNYKDSQKMLAECKYGKAISLYQLKNYKGAFNIFKAIKDFSDSTSYMEKCNSEYIKELKETSFNVQYVLTKGVYEIDQSAFEKVTINSITGRIVNESVELIFDINSQINITNHVTLTESRGSRTDISISKAIKAGTNNISYSFPIKDIIQTGYHLRGYLVSGYNHVGEYYLKGVEEVLISKDLYGDYIFR